MICDGACHVPDCPTSTPVTSNEPDVGATGVHFLNQAYSLPGDPALEVRPVASVDVNVEQPEFVASVRRPIPRRHVVAAIALGAVLIVVVGLGRHGFSTPPTSGSAYTTVAGRMHADDVPDSVAYMQMTEAHHGGPGSDMAPFTARWLVPAVAGLLPIDAGVALQLVNIVLLIAGMACLVLLISGWVRHSATLVVAVVLFSVAVPVLVSAGAVMVDGAAVGLVSMGIWAAYRLPLWAALGVLAVGVMAKETALILVAFGVTLELLRGSGTSRRWARAAAWCVTGGAAYLIARHVGTSGRLVFVPWLPHDVHDLAMLLRMNLGRGEAWILTGLTVVVPVASVVIAAWTSRRHWFRIASVRLLPLSVGVGFAMLLSVWAAAAAWWEPRSAWMALPFGVPVAALLVDAILERGVRSTIHDARFRRIVVTTAAFGFACLVVAAAVSAALPFRAFQSHDYSSRLTGTNLSSFDPVRRNGHGNATLRVPDKGGQPTLLDVDVPHPTTVKIEIPGASRPLFDGRLDKTGTFLIDPKVPGGNVSISVAGPWNSRFRSLNTASRWLTIDALSGHGPNVVLISGGNPFSVAADFKSSTKGPHFQLVGGSCHVPDCPDERAGELPIGLEALVVNDPGDWLVIPQRAHEKGDEVRFSDLK
jgi:hypothetical protein